MLFTSKTSTPNSWKAASAAFRCGSTAEGGARRCPHGCRAPRREGQLTASPVHSRARRNRVAFYDVQGAACPDDGELCRRFKVTKVPAVVATVPGKAPQLMPDSAELTEWLSKLEASAKKSGAEGGVEGGALVSQLRKDNFAHVCPEVRPNPPLPPPPCDCSPLPPRATS